EKIAGLETRHADDPPGIRELAHHQLAGVNDEHGAPRLAFPDDGGTGVEAALDQHCDQEIEACLCEAAEVRRGELDRFQVGGTDSHRTNILAPPAAASGGRPLPGEDRYVCRQRKSRTPA